MLRQDLIQSITKQSDIALESDLYGEIIAALGQLELSIDFFHFTTKEHSSCSRDLDGNLITCPILTLYLKYNLDFYKTGIDPHQGNWNDKWAHTQAIRETLNAILQCHHFDANYVSDYTFIFVHTLEELAFTHIGKECIKDIKQLIHTTSPGVKVDEVYWRGHDAIYYVLMKSKADYKRVKHDLKANITKAIPELLANYDKNGCCQNYKATIELGYNCVVPMGFIREGSKLK